MKDVIVVMTMMIFDDYNDRSEFCDKLHIILKSSCLLSIPIVADVCLNEDFP